MHFEEALAKLRDFLISQNYPPDVTWITPLDILLAKRSNAYVKLPVSGANEKAVRALFEAASVAIDEAAADLGPAIQAVGFSVNRTFAHAWRPATIDEAQRNLVGRGLKLSAAAAESRLHVIEVRSALYWRALRYRHRNRAISILMDHT